MIKENTDKRAKTPEGQSTSELHEFVVEYRKYKTELTKKFLSRKKWTPPDESKVLSFIPGRITKIYVKEGQHVEEGESLMILEAMKMKNTVCANYSGIVSKINVSEGEQVPKSVVIFELNPD